MSSKSEKVRFELEIGTDPALFDTVPGPFECVLDQARGLLVAVAERGYKRWQDLKRRRLHFRRR